jgi:hypothetical protein
VSPGRIGITQPLTLGGLCLIVRSDAGTGRRGCAGGRRG